MKKQQNKVITEHKIEHQPKSCASAVKRNNIKAPLCGQGTTNLQQTLTIKEKLQVLHPTKNQQRNQANNITI